jgi:hypothetical protein
VSRWRPPAEGSTAIITRAGFECLRADIGATPIPLPDGRVISLTVSVGVCTAAEGLSAMLAEADRQLYVAKAGGRNRVECAGTQVTDDDDGDDMPAGGAQAPDAYAARQPALRQDDCVEPALAS